MLHSFVHNSVISTSSIPLLTCSELWKYFADSLFFYLYLSSSSVISSLLPICTCSYNFEFFPSHDIGGHIPNSNNTKHRVLQQTMAIPLFWIILKQYVNKRIITWNERLRDQQVGFLQQHWWYLKQLEWHLLCVNAQLACIAHWTGVTHLT